MASTMTMKQSVLSRQAFTSGSARTARRQPRTVVSAAKVHTCLVSEIARSPAHALEWWRTRGSAA